MSSLKEDREVMAHKFLSNFSKLFSILTKECGLSQKELATLSGLDEATILKMRKMSSPNLSWYNIYKIAKLLNVKMESIIEGTYDIKKIKNHLIKTAKIDKK